MVSPRVASRIARLYPDKSTDDIMSSLRGIDDDVAEELFSGASRADLDVGFRTAFGTRAGETAGEAPVVFARALGETPSTVASSGGRTLRTLGLAGAGGAVGFKGFEALQSREERQEKESMLDAVNGILNDPHIGDEQKNALIKDLISRGFFSGDGPGQGSVLKQLLGGAGIFESVVVLIIIWFIGKALVARMQRSGA